MEKSHRVEDESGSAVAAGNESMGEKGENSNEWGANVGWLCHGMMYVAGNEPPGHPAAV